MEIFDKVLRANEIYATTIPFNNPIGAGCAQLWQLWRSGPCPTV